MIAAIKIEIMNKINKGSKSKVLNFRLIDWGYPKSLIKNSKVKKDKGY